jgi:hypothetical protein
MPWTRGRAPRTLRCSPCPSLFPTSPPLPFPTPTAVVLQPLDVIKTTQQSKYIGLPSTTASSSMCVVAPSSMQQARPASLVLTLPLPFSLLFPSPLPRSPHGVVRTGRDLVREQGGLRALFKGIEPTAVRVFFGAGIYFAALQGIADALGVGTGRGDGGRTSGPDATTAAAAAAAAAPASPPPYAGARTFFAGVAARSIAAAILSPVAVVKTRIEWADARTAPIGGGGTAAAVRHIVRTEGWASLFSGLVPTIVRDAPFSGLYYTSYSQLKEALGAPAAVAAIPLPLVRNFIAGLGAGALATIITHPADVLKTRLQLKVRVGAAGEKGGGGGVVARRDGGQARKRTSASSPSGDAHISHTITTAASLFLPTCRGCSSPRSFFSPIPRRRRRPAGASSTGLGSPPRPATSSRDRGREGCLWGWAHELRSGRCRRPSRGRCSRRRCEGAEGGEGAEVR